MKRLMVYVLLAAGVSMLFYVGCAGDESSTEACRHRVTMNLDKGNFDAVLAEACAGDMQKGAAYFGRAGFDSKDVINRLIESSDDDGGAASSSSLVTSLVGTVDSASMQDLGKAKTSYQAAAAGAPGSDLAKDSRFYIGLVDAMQGLAFLKSVIGVGTLSADCDAQPNNTPDEIDASACAILTSIPQACAAGSTIVTDTAPLSLKTKDGAAITGNYRGLVIEITGNGTNTAGCPTPKNQYKKLLFGKTPNVWFAITTETGAPACPDAANELWPCPILDQNGNPTELVTAFNTALDSAQASLGSAITGTTSDVQTTIDKIKNEACPGPGGICTSEDIAKYLQTIK